jgi:hypothetical protein
MQVGGGNRMRSWLRRGKITAETARRITGISLPFGGLSWADPGPSDAEIVRQFLVFLEDRRALYNPMQLEVAGDVEQSIHQVREQCTRTLQQLGPDAFAVEPLRAIREAGRRFHDDAQEDFPHFDRDWSYRRRECGPGFFVALGALRATVGHQVALLAAYYDLNIEGELAGVVPGTIEDQQE